VSVLWVNGRAQSRIDARDRGLQYGDGVFETMRARAGRIRLLELHLDRLQEGCRRLKIAAPPRIELRAELERRAAPLDDAVLKLILTRGAGARGYRPSGEERSTRVLSQHPAPAPPPRAVRVRLCATGLGSNPALAGLKTLNRLESVLARAEWRDERLWEGLMCDAQGHWVCGTASNFFVRYGSLLMTPRVDRCGVAGVMRRWVLGEARALSYTVREQRVRFTRLVRAEEMFMTNAVAGVVSVARLENGAQRIDFASTQAARRLRARLESL
jgi:4-amino-4-deoxychorismate lyase